MSRKLSNKELSDLADKVLKGQADATEQKRLNLWYSGFDDHLVELDSSDGKETIRHRLLSKINAEISKDQKRKSASTPGKYAAAVVFIIISGLFFLWYQNTLVAPEGKAISQQSAAIITKSADYGQWLTVKLPDGSTVKLNGGSSINYPERFNQNSRNVVFTGEAFFDVVSDKSKPFTIESGDLKVRVLGTSFNVKSYKGDPEINVAVKSGSVLVSKTSGSENITLKPNEMAVYDNMTARIQKEIIFKPNNVFGWIERDLVFDNEPFEQVIKRLSRWYGVEFELNSNRSTEKRITANSTNPTLEEVLESLSHTYDFEYEKTGNKIKIK